MTWVIVQECEYCAGQGELYGYTTKPDMCNECEGVGEVQWYESNYHYDTVEEVEDDFPNTISITLKDGDDQWNT
jgi:DnaJ-class molecular chaperone